MRKTHSKPLAARHAMCESAFSRTAKQNKHHEHSPCTARGLNLCLMGRGFNVEHGKRIVSDGYATGPVERTPPAVWTCNVTLHVHTCSGRNRIIPLMRRPNTDSTPNKPVMLPQNQLLIRYAVTSPVHTVPIRCYDTQ
jgi:hypothetical protein